jgi:hypothetical protein
MTLALAIEILSALIKYGPLAWQAARAVASIIHAHIEQHGPAAATTCLDPACEAIVRDAHAQLPPAYRDPESWRGV